jgi:threonine dehydrogenase-like Zn-dependent dehydrogenase
MKAFCIGEPWKAGLIELPEPSAGAGEVLLRMRRVGFCGTDLSTFTGRNPLVAYPRVPGHEIAATVEALGPGVPESLTIGMNVTVIPYENCGDCPPCRAGRVNACRRNRTLGNQRDGAMAERLVVPWEKILVAEGLGLDELALVEPLTVGFHAVARGRVAPGEVVAVFGCGMIGLGAIAGAAARGARVVAVDIDDGKLGIARSIGAELAVNSATEDLHEALLSATSGDGPAVSIEASGSPHAWRSMVEESSFGARLVCIGYAKDDVALPTRLFVQKELDIMGSRNATKEDFAAVVRHLGRPGFPLDRVIGLRAGLEGAAAALAAWAGSPGRHVKVMVDFDR